MKTKSIALLLLSALMLSNCVSTKKAEVQNVKPAPAWVQNRPVSSTYYVGIGSAVKTADMNQTQQTAKQNALSDLASDISVNISTNSLLSAFEYNTSFTEDFTKTIKTQTEQNLEGYEVVDSYEDQGNYWIYFRLLKSEYQRLKEERKAKAITKSLDFYDKGVAAEKSGDVRLALLTLIKALEPIKPYFSDPLQTNYQGKDIYLGNEIYSSITNVLSSITIEAKNKQVTVKQGQLLPTGSLEFKVCGKNNAALQGMPLSASYTEKPIRNSKASSDINGLASFTVDAVRSNKNVETLKVILNLEAIANEASTDVVIRKLFTRFRTPEGSIAINVVKPIFYVESVETNLDTTIIPLIIAEGLKRKIQEGGYSTTNKEADADYTIRIKASTKVKGEAGNYKQVTLTGSILVKDKSNVEVYSKLLDNITGSHFNYKSAGIEAFKEASKKVESNISREIIEVIVKGRLAY